VIRLTQRQISHGVFGLLFLVTLATVLIVASISTSGPRGLVLAIGALSICGTLWAAYWRGWRYAPHTLIGLLTVLVAFAMPEETIQPRFDHSLYILPVLALVLTGPFWVLGSALFLFTVYAYRVGGGVYFDIFNILIFIMIIGGMMFSRLAVDNAQRVEDARREAEAQRERAEAERERVIKQAAELSQRNEEQQRLLELVEVLETPTIAIAQGVLLAPIVGTLDSRRAQALTNRLLREAYRQRTRQAILDISGVSTVDTQVAHVLIQAAQGLQLLGCEVLVTGITPTVATTLTQLGVDLPNITTLRSPQEALRQIEMN
jgi:anti-anti-sigma regulatory factor